LTSVDHDRLLAPTLQAACERWPERVAIGGGRSAMTYRELWDKVEALARAYVALGVQPGDRIVCQLRNCAEHVIAVNAAWACGAIHAGTDNDLTGPELSWLVEQLDARALVYQPPLKASDPTEPARRVRAGRPATTIVMHGDTPVEGAVPLPELLQLGSESAPFEPRYRGPHETGLLLLTSGTTGRPKAVMETLPACWAKMQFFTDAFRPRTDDVHLLYLPMGHVFGLRLSLLALLSGGRLVLLERFSPEAALRLVTDEGVTILPGMPTHLTLLLRTFDRRRHDVSRLRWAISAASTLPRELAQGVYDTFGAEMLYVYGCSENFTTLTTERAEILDGSVGTTVFVGPEGEPPDGTVRIVDPEDHGPLPPGELGEIAFGARRPVHYWRAPDSATDGWYYTGDLGRLSADGHLYVLGRLKELVNRGGLKVSPSEIEAAIAEHPQVVDAAVVGTPDPVLGEAICACIVPVGPGAPGAPGGPNLAELRSFLAPTLAGHKLPDELAVLHRIPRTKIGKVDRPALAAMLVTTGAAVERLRSP
jgi:acyl-CoA synthetase (AMP-forming)/AMP-acid ligase II